MLNRRHLRIRVLQALYSWNQTPERDLAKAEKAFLKSLQEVEELYTFLLLYLVELRDYAANFIEESKSKRLPTQEDLNPNTKFIDNLFLNGLKDDTALLSLAGAYKLSYLGKEEMAHTPSISSTSTQKDGDKDDQFLKIVKNITSKGFIRSNYEEKLVDLSDVRINLKSKS